MHSFGHPSSTPARRRSLAHRLLPVLLCGLAFPGSALAIDCPIPGPGWKFLGDLNYPDGAQVSPGAVINKGWRLQNCGTTDWVGFKAVRIAGTTAPGDVPAGHRWGPSTCISS
jgi:hypothetical protein